MATAELETKTDLQPAAPSSVSLAISFEETREQLTELVARSSELVVTDVNDKAGIAEVREHRLEFKRIRVSIENRRKSIKAPLLEAERKVDSMAKELTAIIEPEEKRLEHQEKIVEREKARLEQEAAERRKATLERRLAQLRDCITPDGNSYISRGYDPVALSGMTDEAFHELLRTEQEAKDKYDRDEAERKAEQDRIAEEQRLEREKIEKEKAELEERQAAANRRLMVMQKRIERMATLGHQHPHSNDQLADMSNEQWQELVDEAEAKKAEREKAAKAEQERLDKQREEQEAERKKLEAESKRIADEKAAARTRLIQNRVAALAALELYFEDVEFLGDLTAEQWEEEYAKAKANAKQRDDEAAAKEAAEAKAKAEAAEAELARLESLRPDAEKLAAVASAIESIEVPVLSKASADVGAMVEELIDSCAMRIRDLADRMVETK